MKYAVSAVAIVAATVALSTGAIAQDKPTIAFVVNGPSDFWKLTEAGVATAQTELPDVELQFRYPERADAAVQQRVVDDLIAAGVDAIAVSVVDPATSTEAINKALRFYGEVTDLIAKGGAVYIREPGEKELERVRIV